MQYETRKNILSIIIAGTLVIFPVLAFAGTGPAGNAWSEDFYIEREWVGSTSSKIIFYFPASSTAPDQQYFVNYPAYAHGVFATNTITQNGDGCWPNALNDYLIGSSGNSNPSSSLIVPATSGVIIARFIPQESIDPELNIKMTSTPALMITQSPSSVRCSDWDSAYYDFDSLDLGSGSTSTQHSIAWSWPLQDSSGTISNPGQYKFDISGLDLDDMYEYRVEIAIQGSPDPWNFLGASSSGFTTVYERSPWFTATSLSYDDYIVTSTHNLYRMGQIGMYSAIVNLYRRANGINSDIVASRSNLFYVSAYESASSTEQIISYLTGPASSTINSLYSDCTWNDIACGFKNLLIWFFIPWDNSVQAIADVFEGYKSVFPFNVFFLTTEYNGNEGWFAGDVLSQSENTSDDLYLSLNIAGQTSSIKIAGKTFLKDTFGLELTNLLFNIILFVFTLAWVSFVYQTVKFIKI